MKYLKRPYDPEEYLKLLEDWTRQRSAAGHAKNLRSGVIKTYALEGEYGKPYLEVFKGLFSLYVQSSCKLFLCFGFPCLQLSVLCILFN